MDPSETGRERGEVGVDEALAYALKLQGEGHVAAADEVCARILAVAPDHVDALHLRGILHFQRGELERGMDLVRRALEGAPGHADAWNNLGNMLQVAKRYAEAVPAYERAIALRPTFAEAHYNKGKALESLDRHDEALGAYQEAVVLAPFHADTYRRLGAALYSTGRVAEAATVYRKWLTIEPDSELARHMVASCTGEAVPGRTSDASVRKIFERFADSFDEVLGRLQYRAPALVEHALQGLLPPPAADKDVLDAGCGTGLCGPLLKPYARRLVGIDLSPQMLNKARPRGVYDELHEAELTAYLRDTPGGWDLIASADTLVYFGDLQAVLAAAVTALRPGGHLAFTVERAEPGEAPDGFRLNPHGRYSHTEAYLRTTSAAAGLEVLLTAAAHLRLELKKPVEGWVVVVRRPA